MSAALPPAPPASSPATRRVMQGNRSSDTRPEVALRSALHRRGLRFRKHHAPVGGVRARADVVFVAARVAVFVDGCFWHRCPLHGTQPRANAAWWQAKLDRNVERDRRVERALAEAGLCEGPRAIGALPLLGLSGDDERRSRRNSAVDNA